MAKSYSEICRQLNSDKADELHGYARYYERFFKMIESRSENVDILEFGIRHGTSVKSYIEYFKSCSVVGIEFKSARHTIQKFKDNYPNSNIKIIDDTNATDYKTVMHLIKDKKFDIIIDDASHLTSHQILCFEKYFHLVKPGGIYIIEDLHTSYMKKVNDSRLVKEDKSFMSFRSKSPGKHHYGVDNPESAVSYFKNLIDTVNAFGRCPARNKEDFEAHFNKDLNIASITFIRGSCIVEKLSDK